MFHKLLIANRGEIAVRLIRACREMGIRTVAVYSEADANAMHVREADEAVLVGPPPPKESYLNGPRLIEAARAAGAQAIHPGYGFLSENADFADAVRDAGLVFVGPSSLAIRTMGNKTEARTLMQTVGVPIVPGHHGVHHKGQSWRTSTELGEILGYPLLVKAAGGGGGRGMRIVRQPNELAEALASAQREAASAFGDGAIFVEKYLERARHVEFQVFGDTYGNVVQLFERECSIQRRHQKIVEESPSPLLAQHPGLREAMGQAAVAAARAVNYQNAGTVEFIVDPDTLDFFFLEMNTRLQVEHPVTELLTGLDLVQLQLRVAAGERLPFWQAEVAARGHALECRVYAEDPADNFYPSIGPVLKAVEPRGPGLRVDAGFETGDAVSQHYDSMIAKVIAHAPTRAEAIQKMDAALARYILLGITTNLPFLRAVLAHPEFQSGAATTQFIEEHFSDWRPPARTPPPEVFVAAALADWLTVNASPGRAGEAPADDADRHSPWARADGFRLGA